MAGDGSAAARQRCRSSAAVREQLERLLHIACVLAGAAWPCEARHGWQKHSGGSAPAGVDGVQAAMMAGHRGSERGPQSMRRDGERMRQAPRLLLIGLGREQGHQGGSPAVSGH